MQVVLVHDNSESKQQWILKVSDEQSCENETKILRELKASGAVTKLQNSFPPHAFVIEAGMPFMNYYDKAKKPISKVSCFFIIIIENPSLKFSPRDYLGMCKVCSQ
jgi:hypothetical protein